MTWNNHEIVTETRIYISRLRARCRRRRKMSVVTNQ